MARDQQHGYLKYSGAGRARRTVGFPASQLPVILDEGDQATTEDNPKLQSWQALECYWSLVAARSRYEIPLSLRR